MNKKVFINAMGKRIIIDNPDDIDIMFKDRGTRPYKFKLKINKKGMERLQKTFKKIGGG